MGQHDDFLKRTDLITHRSSYCLLARVFNYAQQKVRPIYRARQEDLKINARTFKPIQSRTPKQLAKQHQPRPSGGLPTEVNERGPGSAELQIAKPHFAVVESVLASATAAVRCVRKLKFWRRLKDA